MKARNLYTPYLVLLFTLLILALLEWMNVARPSRTVPRQDEPSQVPFSQQVTPFDRRATVVKRPDDKLGQIHPSLTSQEFLLAGQTYLPLTVYPIRLLLKGSGGF